MPRVCSAKIALPSRVEIEAEIANLSAASVFIKTVEPLRFGDRLTLTLFDVAVEANVAFVSGEPRGAVLVFVSGDALRAQIAMNAADIEVLSPSPETMRDAWLDGLDPNTEPGLTSIAGDLFEGEEPAESAVSEPEMEPALELDAIHLDILPPEIDILAPEELVRVDPTGDLVVSAAAEEEEREPTTPVQTTTAVLEDSVPSPASAAADAARALARSSSGARGLPPPSTRDLPWPAKSVSNRDQPASTPPAKSASTRDQPASAPPAKSASTRDQPAAQPKPRTPTLTGRGPGQPRPGALDAEATLGEMLEEVRRDLGASTPAPAAQPIVLSTPPAPSPVPRPRTASTTGLPPPSTPRISPARAPSSIGGGLAAPTPAAIPAPVLARAPSAVAPAPVLARAPSAVAPAPRAPSAIASASAAPPPPAPRATSVLGTSPTPAAGIADLPLLETDGVTLRFASSDQYRAQHKANIAHGGIIVRSTPLPIGTQKFLGIEIPGRERYTISARVTFIGDGTVGFVVDSFPIHKAQLKAFADA